MPIKNIIKTKVFDTLVGLLKDREELSDAAREAVNTLNRHNTQCCKTFLAFMQQEKLPLRSKVVIDGTEYMYATAETRCIDPKQWFELWRNGEITQEQYFNCLSVGKRDAKLIVGEDQVEAISIDKLGTEADIRRDASNAGTVKGIQVVTPDPVQKGVKPPVPVQKPAQKRNIMVGK